jgi:hypothetical protein
MAGSKVQLSSVQRALVCAVLTALVAVAAGPVSAAMAELPMVTSVTPSSGSTVGGTPVTITGSGFVAGATVTIGSAASEVVVNSETEITATTAATAAGLFEVVVSDANGTSALGPTYTYIAPPPTVESIIPSSGPTAGGTPVTITGSGFVAGATVTIGGNAASSVVFVSAGEITATTPAGSAGAAEVVVTEEGVSSTSGLSPSYTYVAPPPPPPPTAPTITSVTPNSGPTAGGTPVTIAGSGFVVGATVAIGGAATDVVVDSETEITARTPATAAGPVEVVVSDKNGTSTLGPSYTYIPPPPTVTLNAPAPLSNNTTPSFTGSASGMSQVTIEIYKGTSATGVPVSSAAAAPGTGGSWVSGKASPVLENGRNTYTAVASQESSLGGPTGVSSPVTFTVDTTSPTVSLNQPASPSNDTTPSFTGSASDMTQVTVEIYKGSKATGPVVTTASAMGTGGDWTSGNASSTLPDGQYTAVAAQKSSLGNPEGVSNSVVFTVDTAAPTVSLSPPKSSSNNTMPSFTGFASEETPITIQIYAGAAAKGPIVSTATATGTGGDWSSGDASPALPDGQYTAVATQDSLLGNHSGSTVPSTFTVDTVPPHVVLTYPAEESSTSGESQLIKGSASAGAGDLPSVTVQLFSGSAIVNGQSPLQSIVVRAVGGTWSATFAGLSTGTYTVSAEQFDEAGNIGSSKPVTFSVTSPASLTPPAPPTTPTPAIPTPSPAPPAAAFTWVPAKPTTGQSVVLVSSSTDADSPIAAYAWDVTGSGTFTAGGPAITTSFATPGDHTVRLRVTDGNGLTSIATETVPVSAAPLVLMQPFPVVRIAGSESSSGVKLSLLTVQAPVGTRVSVTCGGSRCPSRSESRVVVASRKNSKAGSVLLTFSKFERSLRAGVMLEIRVSKPGEIGKYTSFRIRPNKPPARVDACVGPITPKPIPCPSS